MTNFIHLFAIDIQLQAMMFSKNQSEREIDELHSNYSKWLFLRRQKLRVAKAIPEINANKSVHFISIARHRFNLLLLNLVSFFPL